MRSVNFHLFDLRMNAWRNGVLNQTDGSESDDRAIDICHETK